MLNNMRTFYKRFSAAFYQPRTELEKCLCGSASPAADNVYFRNDRHHHRRHSRFRFSLPGAEKNTRTASTSRKSDRRQPKLIYRPRSNNFDAPRVPHAVHRFSPEPDFCRQNVAKPEKALANPTAWSRLETRKNENPLLLSGSSFQPGSDSYPATRVSPRTSTRHVKRYTSVFLRYSMVPCFS